MTGSGLRLGLVLALFSFVGFESATTLGAEARNPLKSIPRAVIQSSLLAGAFFTVCAYAEVLGFHAVGQDLGASQAPMYVLAQVGGVPVLGLLIDIGALVSLFAGTLACITAAARVLLRMAHDGLAHDLLRTTHARNRTPSYAVIITGIAAVLPVAVLAARGASGLDVYGWMGSLATYGFIVAYALVCMALPRYLRQHEASERRRARLFQLLRRLRCCWLSWAISIRYRKDLTESFPIIYPRLSDCRIGMVRRTRAEPEDGIAARHPSSLPSHKN